MATKKTAKKAPAKDAAAKQATVKKTPVAQKAPAKKAAARKAPAKKSVAGEKTTKLSYTAEQIKTMIEQAAYFAAENDGFRQDSAVYWAQAETSVNKLIKG